MDTEPLLALTAAGLFCPAGDFHIDPIRPVDRAVITHGHADHARAGHDKVLATPQTLDIMAMRYGANFCGTRQPTGYGDKVDVGGVGVRFLPAGHVRGSAQIVLERGGERAVVSGDYKRQVDPTCTPFELVECDLFVTEATFGLP
ncbi:MAG: MBL fold metallo-hydrolase, partial [Pseudomonadota bacterium]